MRGARNGLPRSRPRGGRGAPDTGPAEPAVSLKPGAIGDDGKETRMNASASTAAGSARATLAIATAALIGLGLVILGGHLQAAPLHDAAHDVRHATGFPCH